MPVVAVTAAALADRAADLRAASALAHCLAAALDLGPADVYLTVSHAQVAVVGGEAVRPWPVILVHGRDRPASAAAMQAVGRLAADLWTVPAEQVWVQWITPERTT